MLRKFCLAVIMMIGFTAWSNSGNIAIPYTKTDNNTDFNTWKPAAVIGKFCRPGSRANMPEKTAFYLRHNGKILQVLAVCEDTIPGGRAFMRTPESNLEQDESVQVVLGIGGGESGVLQFGGYEGAFGKLGKASHFYEFSCNRAGSITRRYNETPLPEPLFTARVGDTGRGWNALLEIPFAVAGIDPETNPEILFNAFRFYRGKRYGWMLPNWGNYAAMPFVQARLLAAGEERFATVNAIVPAGPRAQATPQSGFQASQTTLDYYPVQKSLVAVFPASAKAETARITLNNSTHGSEVTLSKDRASIVRFPVDLPEGTEFTAHAEIGHKIHKTITAKVPPYPAWSGNDAGKAYLGEKVSYPWTNPEFKDGNAGLTFGRIHFGRNPLPSAITAGGREILAGPITVEAEAGKRSLALNPLASAKAYPAHIDIASTAQPGLEVKTRVEYDGFTVIRLRTAGVPATSLSRLTVRIPLKSEYARYIMGGSSQYLGQPEGRGSLGDSGPIWVGDVSAGLAFDFDRQVFFSPRSGNQLELTEEKDGTVELKLHLVTAAGQIADPEQVFQFFLLPTPFRQDVIPPDNRKLSLWFENWSDYQGYPDLKKLPEAAQRSADAHAQEKNFYMYFSQVLAENAPGYEYYANEWIAPPPRPWYKRAYNPGKGVPCRVVCFRGDTGDLLLDGIKQLAEKAGIDGVYFDGPSHPFDCANPSHQCDDRLPAQWNDDYCSGRVLGQRAFLKRVRGIFDEQGKKFPIWAHTGGGISLATLALADYYYDGEQLSRYAKGYLLEPEKVLVNYSGAPFGFRGIFLPQLYFDSQRDCTRALPWNLPHGFASTGKSSMQDLYFDRFRAAGGKFHPYWKDQSELRRQSLDQALVSYWIGNGDAMLVAANVRYIGTQKVKVDVSRFFPDTRLAVECVNDPGNFEFDGAILSFSVPEAEMRLFSIRPESAGGTSVPEKAETVHYPDSFAAEKGFQADKWKIKGTKKQSDAFPATIESVKYAPASEIIHQGELPKNVCIDLKLRHSGRLEIRFNGVKMTHDGGQWRINGFSAFDQSRQSTTDTKASHPNTVVPVRIQRIDGRIYVNYNGTPLVHYGLPKSDGNPHQLSFGTWAGDSLELDCEQITDQVDLKDKAIHPVASR